MRRHPRRRKAAEFPGDWTLYHLPETGSFLWQPFRLMLPPGTPARRGVYRRFTLVWNPVECRFARSRSVLDLLTQQPDLAAEVELCLSLEYGPAWLSSEDGGGYTADEIQAERARLQALRTEARRNKG